MNSCNTFTTFTKKHNSPIQKSQEKLSKKIKYHSGPFSSVISDNNECDNRNKKEDNTFLFKHLNQRIWDPSFAGRSDSHLLVLTAFIVVSRGKRVTFPAVKTIALLVGISVRHCRRMIDELVEDGLLAKYNRYLQGKYYQSCAYMLSNVLFLPRVYKKIYKKIKSSLSEYVTLLKEKFLNLFKKTINILFSRIRYFSLERRVSMYDKKSVGNLTSRNKDPVFFKKRCKMRTEFSKVIEHKLPFLKLTRAGKIKLSVFPEKILYKALSKFQQHFDRIPLDPFTKFYAFCLLETKRLAIPPNLDSLSNLNPENMNGDVTFLGERLVMQECHRFMDQYKKMGSKRPQKTHSYTKGATYTVDNVEYKLPDQAIYEKEDTPAIDDRIQPDQTAELKKAIETGLVNKKGLEFLRWTFSDKPELLNVADEYLEEDDAQSSPF